MVIRDGAPDENRSNLSDLLTKAGKADLLIVPELWSSGYAQTRWKDIAVNDSPATMDWMAANAKKRGLWIGGSLIVVTDDCQLANRFVLFDRDGCLACQYDKVHLFVPMQEDVYLKPGLCLPPIIDVEGIKMSPAICYDLRFPEMFRFLALAGVEAFLVPSEWPHPREDALRTLALARAIENQAFLVLANRVGPDGRGNVFCGQSAIFGPTGVIAEAGVAVGSVTSVVDIHRLREIRKSFPVLTHRCKGVDYEQCARSIQIHPSS